MKGKKFNLFLQMMVMCGVFFIFHSLDTQASEQTIAEDGVHTYVEKISEEEELITTIVKKTEPISSRASKSATAGVYVSLKSNGTTIAHFYATANFSYNGTYVWCTNGTAYGELYAPGYTWNITKNSYSSAKVTTLSTYYTTNKIYRSATLIDTSSNNIKCNPNGVITVTH